MMMRGVRQAQQFGQDDAGLPVAQIVGLQAGQDQIRLLRFARLRPASCAIASGSNAGRFSSSMWMARSAPLARASRMVCERASGPGAKHHHLAAVLFFQLQPFFERIGIGLVDFEAEIGFFDPAAALNRCAVASRAPGPA